MRSERIQKVLNDRYLKNGETEEDMYRRVAECVAQGDDVLAVKFFEMMNHKWFLPNTPTLVNAGVEGSDGCFSACFVLPIGDSQDEIYKAADEQAKIHKAFGGTGFNLSCIRPKGSPIGSTGGKACGPVEVARFLNASSRMIMQGGVREGANIGVLNDDHADIEDWITCKRKGSVLEEELRHFNLSVGSTDEFMRGALEGDDYDVKNRLRLIAHQMWETGDPGMFFLDTVNANNPTPKLGNFDACNPCGEQPLLPYEACNLGSINLALMVNSDGTINYKLLDQVIGTAVMFLDMVIDVNPYPLDDITNAVLRTRKIGLGIMGLHDFLIKLNVAYDSDEGVYEAGKIMSRITDIAEEASHQLALVKGSFPAWEDSIWDVPMRNASITTIAPTGTISMIAECSSGIEPVFAWSYTQEIESGKFTVHHPTYEIAKERGMLQTSYDISPEWQIKMLAAIQNSVHNAVSKTINLPEEATEDEVYNAIVQAWKSGCKGMTVYRDGSKDCQVLRKVTNNTPITFADKHSHPGHTDYHRSGCGSVRTTVNMVSENDERLHEVIVNSNGGCSANNEAIGKLISLGLQHGVDPNVISNTLHGVKCTTAMRSQNSEGKSCADIIAKSIDNYAGESQFEKEYFAKPVCPECNQPLDFGEGCNAGKCSNCGWSGCQ